jgi:hypothetical protein
MTAVRPKWANRPGRMRPLALGSYRSIARHIGQLQVGETCRVLAAAQGDAESLNRARNFSRPRTVGRAFNSQAVKAG